MVAFVAAQWSGAGVGGRERERERERALRGGVEGKKEKKRRSAAWPTNLVVCASKHVEKIFSQ